MAHGGKIAVLGIPSREMPIDWRAVIFNMLTIKGIYGREMYETWYEDERVDRVRRRLATDHYASF